MIEHVDIQAGLYTGRPIYRSACIQGPAVYRPVRIRLAGIQTVMYMGQPVCGPARMRAGPYTGRLYTGRPTYQPARIQAGPCTGRSILLPYIIYMGPSMYGWTHVDVPYMF